ncbi:predicted protein, partial [Nematostella vectensis]
MSQSPVYITGHLNVSVSCLYYWISQCPVYITGHLHISVSCLYYWTTPCLSVLF